MAVRSIGFLDILHNGTSRIAVDSVDIGRYDSCYVLVAFFGVGMNDYKKVYTFPNGYGASVVCNSMSYGNKDGLFEVAILKGDDICYDTPLTNDVIGFLDFHGVADILDKIKAL